MGDRTICEIATCLKHCQTSLDSRAVHHDMARIEQIADRLRNILLREFRTTAQYRDQFT